MTTKYTDPQRIAVGAGARERQALAENRVMEMSASILSGVHVYDHIYCSGTAHFFAANAILRNGDFYKLMQAAFVAIAWSGAR